MVALDLRVEVKEDVYCLDGLVLEAGNLYEADLYENNMIEIYGEGLTNMVNLPNSNYIVYGKGVKCIGE
ncbi:hypothetical protein MG295_00109 [Bacillus phage vB_BcgM]|nr:hypothetical protein MG295_00109 [Bacillus phage vB_BcgM]